MEVKGTAMSLPGTRRNHPRSSARAEHVRVFFRMFRVGEGTSVHKHTRVCVCVAKKAGDANGSSSCHIKKVTSSLRQ